MRPPLQLTDTELLRRDQVDALVKWSVRTVEELVGAIEADEASVAFLLHLSPAELKNLHDHAMALLVPEVRRVMERQRGRKHPLGAVSPGFRDADPVDELR